MKLKVNDYVRYVRGAINGYVPPKIAKIKEIVSKELIKLDNQQVIMNNDVIKSSSKIIDLIERGDIIELDNSNDVYKVGSIPNKEYGSTWFYLEYDLHFPDEEDIYISKKSMEKHLKTIFTKEQFESMSYKVED